MSNTSLGQKLRDLRLERKLPLRKVAAMLDIDVAILSKMERGERKLTKELIQKLAGIYEHALEELMVLYLSEKILYVIENEDLGAKALKAAEAKVAYRIAKPKSKNEVIPVLKSFFENDTRVKSAYLFGSVARGEEKPSSDVDIMVRFHENLKITLFDFADITHSLEVLLNRKIDLVEEGSLLPFALKTAQNDLIKIHG